MRTETFGPLYARSSTDKTKTWQAMVVEEDGKPVLLNTLHGYIDGRKTSSSKEIKGKNLGKANETSPYEQACSDAQSKMNKKLDEGYVTALYKLKGQSLLLPMLAHPYTKRKHDIKWPAIVQPKLNGVRCLSRMTEDTPEYISRKGKKYDTVDHLNKEVEYLTCELGVPLDGEIFHPDWTFQEIVRAVKKDRGDKTDELQYWVYDIVDTQKGFEDRAAAMFEAFVLKKGHWKPGYPCPLGNVVLVPSVEVANEEEMMVQHKKYVDAGYEGTIIRNKDGKYILKNRSKDLQKYKDFLDEEYIIVGGKEATGNDAGTVVFECKTKEEKTFAVRPKGSRELRREWLTDLDKIIGKPLTVRYQELSEDGVPIFPVGIEMRDYE